MHKQIQTNKFWNTISISAILTLLSGFSISTLAQENKPNTVVKSTSICEKIKTNLNAKFDSKAEKIEAMPFKLQTILGKKIQTAKSKGKDTAKLDKAIDDFKPKLEESKTLHLSLFESLDKLKTDDCEDAKMFDENFKYTRETILAIKTQNNTLRSDLRLKIVPELRNLGLFNISSKNPNIPTYKLNKTTDPNQVNQQKPSDI